MRGGTFETESEYAYSGRDTYMLDHYMERVTFAKYQVQRQLEYAVKRKRDQAFEIKVFIGVLLCYITIYHLSYMLAESKNIFLFLIGEIVLVVSEIAYLFVVPVCIYRIIRGGFILLMDRLDEVKTYSLEIEECQKYLEKYKLLLEDLYQWKEEIIQGGIIDDAAIYERVHKVELSPDIPVMTDAFGKMGKFYTVSAILLTILFCVVYSRIFW